MMTGLGEQGSITCSDGALQHKEGTDDNVATELNGEDKSAAIEGLDDGYHEANVGTSDEDGVQEEARDEGEGSE